MKAMDGATKLNGGSIVAGHSGEIDILSDSQGEIRCDGCGKATLTDFSAMIKLSAATIALKKKTLNGTFLTSIDVAFIKAGPTPFTYYKIHMENVATTSVQESASSEEPIFAVSFAPARIAWQHVKQNSDGSQGTRTTYGWDVAINAAWNYVFP
jgi:type VI protein secretion system component Hcp